MRPSVLRLILASILAALLPAGAICADASKESLSTTIAGLQRHYRETDSFSATFKEEIAPVGSPKRTRSGTMYFRKPGRMRWEFDGPSKELIVSNGTDLYNYDPELNQVVEAPLSQALRSPGATEFLLGVGDVTKDFTPSLIKDKDSDGLIHVKLVPKSPGNTVELGLEPQTCDIRTIRVIDQLGDVTDLKLNDLERDKVISDAMFQFSPPAGADIVRPTPMK